MMIMDDRAAHQTLDVSIKKPISVVRTFCRRALNEFTEVASSALAGSLFHLFTTLSEKKWSLRSFIDRFLINFSECPLVLVSDRNSKDVDVGTPDRPLTILYSSIRSALLRLSSRDHNPSHRNRSV